MLELHSLLPQLRLFSILKINKQISSLPCNTGGSSQPFQHLLGMVCRAPDQNTAPSWPRLHMEIQCYPSLEKLQCSLCFIWAKEKPYTAPLPCFVFSKKWWVLLCWVSGSHSSRGETGLPFLSSKATSLQKVFPKTSTTGLPPSCFRRCQPWLCLSLLIVSAGNVFLSNKLFVKLQ